MRYPVVLALLITLLSGAPAFAQTAFDDPNVGGGSTTGSLIAVEPTIAVGKLTLGSTAQAIIRFRNDGAQAITFGAVNLYPSSNVSVSIALNQCANSPLQLGGECAVVLAIKALKVGPFQAQILVQHSGRSKLITSTLTGDIETSAAGADGPSGEIQSTPATLDFGAVIAARPTLQTIELRNITSDPLTITSVDLDSPQKTGFQIKNSCGELLSGQGCLVSVVWSPAQEGGTNGFIVVNHTGASKITSIPFKGDYKPTAIGNVSQYPQPIPGKGLLVVDQEEIDFGDDVDSESSVTLTLANAGDTNLTLRAINLSVVTPGMTIDPSGCKPNQVLKSTDACPLTLRWAPQKKGKIKTDLRVVHDGTRGVLVLPVVGEASAAAQGGSGFAGVPTVASAPIAENDADEAGGTAPSSALGISTDLPGSAGLSLDDISDLNSALSGDIADVIERASGSGKRSNGGGDFVRTPSSTRKLDIAAAALSNYIVTTHSINRAIILGPNGSQIVKHNKPVVIAGQKWIPTMTPDGVDFQSDNNGVPGKTVSLVFDGSIAANQSLLTDNSRILGVEGEEVTPTADAVVPVQNNAATPVTDGGVAPLDAANGIQTETQQGGGDTNNGTGLLGSDNDTGLDEIFTQDTP